MRNLKKVLSLALCLVMLLGMMVVGAGAAEYKDADKIENKEAVAVLTAIGVVEGTDDNFNPTKVLDRAEGAAIIYRLLTGGTVKNPSAGVTGFVDVDNNADYAWAKGIIADLAQKGIISGEDKTHFNPSGELTGAAFSKMLLVALGYNAESQGYVGGGWEGNVIRDAYGRGITVDGVIMTNNVTRDQAAQMAFKTLTATMVSQRGGIQIGEVVIPGYAATDISHENTSGYKSTSNDGWTQFCEAYFPNLKLDLSVTTDAVGLPASKWVYNKDDVATSVDNSAILATYTDDVGSVTKGQVYRIGGTANVDIYVNGIDSTTDYTAGADKFASAKAFDSYKGATVYVLDTDHNGTADQINVVYGYLAQVTKVNDASSSADRSVDLKVYRENAGQTISKYETEEFEKDQWVMVYPAKAIGASFVKADVKDVKAVAEDDMVVGTVSKVDGTNGSNVSALTMDGTKYNVAKDELSMMAPATSVKGNDYSFKNEYTLFLSNGFVIGVTGETATTDISDIVYVTRRTWSATDEYGVVSNSVEVVRMDGTTDIIKTKATAGTSTNETGIATDTDNNAKGFYKVTKNNVGQTVFEKLNTTLTDNFGGTALTAGVNMDTSTKSVAVTSTDGKTKAYVTGNTRLLFIGTAVGADLKVTLETGAMKQNLGNGSLVLVSKNSAGNLIAEAIILATSKVDVNSEIVYITATKTGSNSIGDLYTMYNTAGEKSDVPVDGGAPTAGFATYSVDEDGAYSFADATAASGKNADGVHTVTAQFASVYAADQLLSINTTEGNLEDISAADAAIVDLRSSEDKTAAPVESLNDLDHDVKITGEILVRDGKVETIVLTAGPARVAGSKATYTSETVSAAATTKYFAVTLGGVTEYVADTNSAVNDQASAWKTAYEAGLTSGVPSGWTAAITNNVITYTKDDNTAVGSIPTAFGLTVAANNGVTFSDGDGSTAAAKITITLSAAVTDKVVKVTVSGKGYYVADSNDTVGKQLIAWKTAYNADTVTNTDYTADTAATATSTSGTIVLTAKADGAKADSGASTNVTVASGTWTNGTTAE